LVALVLAGCASNGNIAPQSQLLDAQQQLHLKQTTSSAISTQWWRSLRDPQLDSLMTLALNHSPSLHQAAARVREAQSVVGETRAANGPNVDLNASSERQRIAQNIYQPMVQGYPDKPIYETANTLGFNLSYEIDWWGKYHNQVQAAKSQVDSALAEQQQAALLLTTSVASTYYLLQSDMAKAEVIQKEVDNNQRQTDLRKAQYQAGISGVDIPRQSQAQLDSARQQIIQLNSQIEQLKHQLAALTVQAPDALTRLHPVALPSAESLSPKGELTLDLLGKRPDIVAQRQLVESYAQRIEAAKKDFYPSLSISAFGGLTTTNYGVTHPNLLEAASQSWNVAPALSLPIFHAGALRSKLAQESALYDQAVESYNQTILNAVQQTADAITVQKSSAAQLQQALSVTQSLQDVYRIAAARYQAGVIGRNELLNSEAMLLQKQQAQLDASSNLVQAKIGLIRALGGGYQATHQE
jgi:NodT family efflux transporter outer membrane factor (OMF) lipoprotein